MKLRLHISGELIHSIQIQNKTTEDALVGFHKIPAEDFQVLTDSVLVPLLQQANYMDPKHGTKTDVEVGQIVSLMNIAANVKREFAESNTYLEVQA
jgi:hypothetical protein